ncbi:MAG: hypothetical protein WDO18_21305 [Acidobacteriota bacterium]
MAEEVLVLGGEQRIDHDGWDLVVAHDAALLALFVKQVTDGFGLQQELSAFAVIVLGDDFGDDPAGDFDDGAFAVIGSGPGIDFDGIGPQVIPADGAAIGILGIAGAAQERSDFGWRDGFRRW